VVDLTEIDQHEGIAIISLLAWQPQPLHKRSGGFWGGAQPVTDLSVCLAFDGHRAGSHRLVTWRPRCTLRVYFFSELRPAFHRDRNLMQPCPPFQ
jgi:hypothetical protein